MGVSAALLLLAALPALTGVGGAAEGGGGAGGGPVFLPRQATRVRGVVGGDAELHCTVLRLGDKSVSWVRSRDLQILTHAGSVFTADARVSATVSGAPDGPDGLDGPDGPDSADSEDARRHSLRLAALRPGDAGRYECQVNTEPKMSLFFNLTVSESPPPPEASPPPLPEAPTVSVSGPRDVWRPLGGEARLACEARWAGPAEWQVQWYRAGRRVRARGGAGLEARRWAGGAAATLALGALRPRDRGRYTCAALPASPGPGPDPGADEQPPPGAAPAAHVDLHVGPPGEGGREGDAAPAPAHASEAMQRDEAPRGRAGRAGRAAGGALSALALLLLAS